MKKFLLYFLFTLFLVAVGTMSFGFYNGKNIRNFAQALSELKASNNFSDQIGAIETSFRDSGKKEISQIREESKQFTIKLDEIAIKAESAEAEINSVNAPKIGENTKKLAGDYYAKTKKQAKDLQGIMGYMSQIIEVAEVFGQMDENISLDEIKNIISTAKEKGAAVKTEKLPQELQASAQNLKEAMNVFLLKMDEVATLKQKNTEQLDAAYDDFSQRENEFFSAAKIYIDRMENLDIIENGIDSEIAKLQKIYFSLR